MLPEPCLNYVLYSKWMTVWFLHEPVRLSLETLELRLIGREARAGPVVEAALLRAEKPQEATPLPAVLARVLLVLLWLLRTVWSPKLSVTRACSTNSPAFGRWSGCLCKQRSTKSLPLSVRQSGIGGLRFVVLIICTAA
mmetsp:Transcript_90510/g.156933  ORF Transcript_90510/g.156933 Transcript_90510/m.156933 type:complete len:139 (-) Transcript_90510:1403-1819(-)